MYRPSFAGKSRQMCIQLRAQLHRKVRSQLDSELHREQRKRLHAALFDALLAKLFETLFEKTFAALFRPLFKSKCRPFQASTYLALCRQRLQGRRPPGRSPHDRIVVRSGRTSTYRQPASVHPGGIESASEPVHLMRSLRGIDNASLLFPAGQRQGLRRISRSETRCTKRHMNESGA